jgi:hypothetical protein
MLELLHQFRRWAGVDRPVLFVLATRAWSLVTGPVSVLAVGLFLSQESQGYYYTFGSLIGLQVFLEMGFNQAIIQFASHEFALLHWSESGTLDGNAPARSRLLYLGRLSLKIYGTASVLFPFLVGVVGDVFFQGRPRVEVDWLVPWWLTCLATSANLILLPAWSLLEGCNQVAFVARCRFYNGVFASITLWSVLLLGGGLFAVPASAGASFLSGLFLLCYYRTPFFKQVVREQLKERIFWWGEIWPFHWRMAISAICGFMITNLFNPVIFYFHGAVLAGKMGITLSLTNSIGALALSWTATKAAPFGILINKRLYAELDTLARRATIQAVTVCALGSVAMLIALFWLKHYSVLGSRFTDINTAALLCMCALVNQIIYSQAYYLRAHKKEPFMVPSILAGFLTAIGVVIGARYFQTVGAATGYLLSQVTVMALTTSIYYKCKRLWHQDSNYQKSLSSENLYL